MTTTSIESAGAATGLVRLAGAMAFVALLSGCMSPRPPHGMPDASIIGFSPDNGGRAIMPECEALVQPSGMIDAGRPRPGVAFGCATYSNLAAMIARPADLVAPLPYAGADTSLATDAVRRYREGRLIVPGASSTTPSPTALPAAPVDRTR